VSSPLIVSGKTVHRLRRGGVSPRDIAEETLSPRTVRTIIDQRTGTDRTDQASAAWIDPDHAGERILQAKRRMRQALPRNTAAVEKAKRQAAQKGQGAGDAHHRPPGAA
jgi:hypothetical protein